MHDSLFGLLLLHPPWITFSISIYEIYNTKKNSLSKREGYSCNADIIGDVFLIEQVLQSSPARGLNLEHK
jgi:hypothetical protein